MNGENMVFKREYINHTFIYNNLLDNKKPQITIITAYFNNKNLIRTIESVLKQNYSNIEYIIADDCSNNFEKTLKEIEQLIITHNTNHFASIRMQIQNKNVGTVKNINDAIKQATGEIIYFLAADDIFYSENTISNWTDFFRKTNSFVVTSRYCICKENENNMQCIRPTKRQIRNIKYLQPCELYSKIAYQNSILGCCTAYRKDCFELYGYFDETYRLLEDHPMVLNLLKQGVKIAFWDAITIFYMDNGISAVKSENFLFEADVELLIKNEADYKGDDAEQKLRLYRINKKKIKEFYAFWDEKKYIKIFLKYPELTIKEVLKPFRAMLVKLYLRMLKMLQRK